MEQATLAGELTTEKVSFYMDIASGLNYADFGDWELDSVKDSDEDNITWLDMPWQTTFWFSAAVQAVQIGENEYTATGRTAQYAYAADN